MGLIKYIRRALSKKFKPVPMDYTEPPRFRAEPVETKTLAASIHLLDGMPDDFAERKIAMNIADLLLDNGWIRFRDELMAEGDRVFSPHGAGEKIKTGEIMIVVKRY